MAIERTYTVPLRPYFRKSPRYYRTNRAMTALKDFLIRHMKADEEKIRIGQHLNEFIWKHGIRNPPPRVSITVRKSDDGIVTAELEGQQYKESVKPQARTEEPTGLKEKLQAAVGKKDTAEPTEVPAEEPKAEEKPKEKKPPAKKAPAKKAAKKE